jgi:8-oxo-dGTP pyrophosphatase MutT (NUDIX family)
MRKVIPQNAILIPDDAERVFTGEIFDVYQWPQQMYDGSFATFEMLKRDDTAGAICIMGDGKIIVLNENQPHSNPRVNFPAGHVDPEDETTLVAAQREVREETGYSFKNWRLIKVWQPYGKIEDFIYLYLAWDVESKAEPIDMPGEKITLNFLSFEEVKQKVQAREGYLGEDIDIFEKVNSVDELLALPEFEGKIVDR